MRATPSLYKRPIYAFLTAASHIYPIQSVQENTYHYANGSATINPTLPKPVICEHATQQADTAMPNRDGPKMQYSRAGTDLPTASMSICSNITRWGGSARRSPKTLDISCIHSRTMPAGDWTLWCFTNKIPCETAGNGRQHEVELEKPKMRFPTQGRSGN